MSNQTDNPNAALEEVPMDNHTESDFSEEEVAKTDKELLNEELLKAKGHGGFSIISTSQLAFEIETFSKNFSKLVEETNV